LSPQTDQLRNFLADSDIPCPNCGYNLRTLTADRCPECDEHLTLEVRITHPRLGALMAAGAGLLAGAGAAAVFAVAFNAYAIKMGRWPLSDRAAAFALSWFPLIVTAVEGGLALFLLRAPGRTWFRRLHSSSRFLVILGAWGLTGAAVILFIRGVPG
jgi:hypothetical protein